MRIDGRLQRTDNRSEVCQYFAFFFGTATTENFPELHRVLRDEFGPHRVKKGLHPKIHPAKAFVGNVLRMELPSRWGQNQQLLDESLSYFHYMAERTGTLWENTTPSASCNHGFASHLVRLLYRDVLGIQNLDPVGRKVTIRIPDLRLSWCEGQLPLAEGTGYVRWWNESGRLRCKYSFPAGYTIVFSDDSQATVQ